VLSDEDVRFEQGWSLVLHPIESGSVSPVGYDIRLGFAYRLTKTGLKDDFHRVGLAGPDTSIDVGPGELAFVETLEFVWLSRAIGATCHVKGSLGTKGMILCNPSTVDPNWGGDLVFVLRNDGLFPIELKHGMPVITLVFHRLDTPTRTRPITRVRGVTNFYDAQGERDLSAALTSYDNRRYEDRRQFEAMVDAAAHASWWRSLRHQLQRMGQRISRFLLQ
jgi:deoxycytidine triphosphate deaminase